MSKRTKAIGAIGLVLGAVVLYLIFSLSVGGHAAGPTHIEPGNIGLVLI